MTLPAVTQCKHRKCLAIFLSFLHEIFLEIHNRSTKGCYIMGHPLDEIIQKLSYIFNLWCCSAVYSGCTILQQCKAAPQHTHQMKWVYCYFGHWSRAKPIGCTLISGNTFFSCRFWSPMFFPLVLYFPAFKFTGLPLHPSFLCYRKAWNRCFSFPFSLSFPY